ncbi:MAG: (Fe-S)-binding protein [Deltaproteobacteria bacterium]|nr:(Fe-S)-binding protein [Deltaproteobacteria bacterium]
MGFPLAYVYVFITCAGICVFAYILYKRLVPLLRAAPDARLDRIGARLGRVLRIWLAQWRQPRYLLAGVIHIFIFAGFLILGARSLQLILIGFWPGATLPGMDGQAGASYNLVKDYAATWVFVACLIAAVRRGVFRPARYQVPSSQGKNHLGEALLVLGLICALVVSESLFEASLQNAEASAGAAVAAAPPLTLLWAGRAMLSGAGQTALQAVNSTTYFVHEVVFFSFLCFLPLGKHFHVITSLFNVFFMRLDRGNLKPVRYGVSEEQLEDLPEFGVNKLGDFTWKHLLDFYTCADCGRCSDRCPANRVKRPLSPRFLTIKARDQVYSSYPIWGGATQKAPDLVGGIYSADEIWSCTTCGACEQECPLGIEYIDKIVDLRRGMVDQGNVPQSLQKPLSALEKRGNPWGKSQRNRADWTKELAEEFEVPTAAQKQPVDTLYFVGSVSSYDERMQAIAQATARVLHGLGVDFGVLGKNESDAGHEVRRFGEEFLFLALRDANTQAILNSSAARIVTADPHDYNALKNDYSGIPPVMHMSQVLSQVLENGALALEQGPHAGKTVVYHDPCYLGRHNGLYDEPRRVIDAIPGLRRVEMEGNCRDRSFCCGGGGLALFYEPEEEERIGVARVRMAEQCGAQVIVTACPFCLANLEDALKIAGLDKEMEALDLMELVGLHLPRSGQRRVAAKG